MNTEKKNRLAKELALLIEAYRTASPVELQYGNFLSRIEAKVQELKMENERE